MRAVITLRMVDPDGGSPIPAYLADGSHEPIIWDDAAKASAWAHMHRSLFENGPAERIVRDRLGLVSGEYPEDMLEDRKPCCLLNDDLVQEGAELVGTDGTRISLEPDMEEYERRLSLPADQRPFS